MGSLIIKLLSPTEIVKTFIRFYSVGLLLFILPFTRDFFISITGLSLLMVIGTIFYFHRGWNIKTILFFLFILFSSFFLEMEGTKTGRLFGTYYYDSALGFKINGTPVIIGLNWLFLVYASHDISNRISGNGMNRILIAATVMLFYDLLLEWVAPSMQMWHFDSAYPPIKNFLTWFIAAIVFNSGFEIFKIRTDNMPARRLFVIQAAFLFIIGIYSLFFIT